MTYPETIDYLYRCAPLFQHIGGGAYKEGLSTTLALDEHFGHPHTHFPTIHVAGTNGKGSVCHTLAAFLQLCGLKVGLYTSPHLVDFRERIRINGRMMPEDYVVRFVEEERAFFEPLHPSFFELTTALAFKYFSEQKVDVAVIEVGLGGRLDCTNIIRPCLSVITNISLDHTQFLGHTLAAIASEKAGIIKDGVPVVVGESTTETRPVFEQAARDHNAPIVCAEDEPEIERSFFPSDATDPDAHLYEMRQYETRHFGTLRGALTGDCQTKNANTILHAIQQLRRTDLLPADCDVERNTARAFEEVCTLTGLMGRWQVVRTSPLTICDTGHNIGGWQYLGRQLTAYHRGAVHVVFGMMKDKDVDAVLALLPPAAHYYFTQASTPRALPANELAALAQTHNLTGQTFPDVPSAVQAAQAAAQENDMVFIGGSGFVVADFMAHCKS